MNASKTNDKVENPVETSEPAKKPVADAVETAMSPSDRKKFAISIKELAESVNQAALTALNQRTLHIAEMRLRAEWCKWSPRSFGSETAQKNRINTEMKEWNVGRMLALKAELDSRDYVVNLANLNFKVNTKLKTVADAGVIQVEQKVKKGTDYTYEMRHSNTHNTINGAWLKWCWADPNAAFRALKNSDAYRLIYDWKDIHDEKVRTEKARVEADIHARGVADGTIVETMDIPSDCSELGYLAFVAGESWKRNVASFLKHTEGPEADEFLTVMTAKVNILCTDLVGKIKDLPEPEMSAAEQEEIALSVGADS